MFTERSSELVRALTSRYSAAADYRRTYKLALTAGFIAFGGLIISGVALWAWLWHGTEIQDTTVFRIVGTTVIALAFYLYTHIRKGFGTFFLIIVISNSGLAFALSPVIATFIKAPFICTGTIIACGICRYFYFTRSVFGTLSFALCGSIASIYICFNPAFITTWVFGAVGIALIIIAVVSRFFIHLEAYF